MVGGPLFRLIPPDSNADATVWSNPMVAPDKCIMPDVNLFPVRITVPSKHHTVVGVDAGERADGHHWACLCAWSGNHREHERENGNEGYMHFSSFLGSIGALRRLALRI
jgi:hypothetical protein